MKYFCIFRGCLKKDLFSLVLFVLNYFKVLLYVLSILYSKFMNSEEGNEATLIVDSSKKNINLFLIGE
jgi:hypothetical protein